MPHQADEASQYSRATRYANDVVQVVRRACHYVVRRAREVMRVQEAHRGHGQVVPLLSEDNFLG